MGFVITDLHYLCSKLNVEFTFNDCRLYAECHFLIIRASKRVARVLRDGRSNVVLNRKILT